MPRGGQRLETLYYDLEARLDKFSHGIHGAERLSERLAKKIRAHPMAALGALTATAAIAGVQVMRMGIEFDTAMRRATASIPEAQRRLADFKRAVLDVSTRTGIAANEIAEGLRTLASVGGREMQEPAAALRRLDLAAMASKASGESLETVIRSLDDVMDAYSLSGHQAAESTLRLAFGAARGRAPFGEFLSVLTATAPAAAAANVPINELAASIGALFELGVAPTDMTRALKQELTGVADGGEQAVTKLDRLGIVIRELDGHLSVRGQDGRTATQGYADALGDAASNSEALGEALQHVVDGPGDRFLRWANQLKNALLSVGSSGADALLGGVTAAFSTGHTPPVRTGSVPQVGGFDMFGGGGQSGPRGPIRTGDVARDTFGNSGLRPPPTPEQIRAAAQATEELRRQTDAAFGHIRSEYGRLWTGIMQDINGQLQAMHPGLDNLGRAIKQGGDEWQRQWETLGQLRERLEQLREAAGEDLEVRQQLTEKIREVDRIQARMSERQEKDLDGKQLMAKLERERTEELANQARNIEASARGAIQLADAFELIDDRTASTLQNIAQVAASIPAMLGAIEKGGAAGIAGAALPILGGLAGIISSLGTSPEEERRREEFRANTEAIRELTQRIGESALAISGTQFGGLSAATSNVLRHFEGTGDARQRRGEGRIGEMLTNETMAQLEAELRRMGLTMSDLRQVAAELGITFNGTLESVYQLQQALNAAELDRVFNSFQGQMDLLQQTLDLFDVDDPVEALTRLQSTIVGLGSGALAGIQQFDLTTAEGRAAAEAFLQNLFTQATTGGVGAGDFGAFFGGLTPTEFLAAIAQLEAAIDAAGAQAGDGTTQNIGVNRSITEITAARMGATLQTIAYHEERTARATEAIERLLASTAQRFSVVPPTWRELNAFGGGGGSGGGPITINVTVNGAGAGAAQLGQQVGDAVVEALDRALGNKNRQGRRHRGDITVN